MPSTTPARAARWPGGDSEAIGYLEVQGFTLTRQWQWVPPSSDHALSEREADAIVYLIQEWDFGGIKQVEEKGK